MALHLIKLCVGVDAPDDLIRHVEYRRAGAQAAGHAEAYAHITRMVPKRASDLAEGGSLYWVIRGFVQARQAIVGIEPFSDHEGTTRCRIVLEPQVVLTRNQPRRPFQGWRYLKPDDAPPDLPALGEGDDDLPPQLNRELQEIGVF